MKRGRTDSLELVAADLRDLSARVAATAEFSRQRAAEEGFGPAAKDQRIYAANILDSLAQQWRALDPRDIKPPAEGPGLIRGAADVVWSGPDERIEDDLYAFTAAWEEIQRRAFELQGFPLEGSGLARSGVADRVMDGLEATARATRRLRRRLHREPGR